MYDVRRAGAPLMGFNLALARAAMAMVKVMGMYVTIFFSIFGETQKFVFTVAYLCCQRSNAVLSLLILCQWHGDQISILW